MTEPLSAERIAKLALLVRDAAEIEGQPELVETFDALTKERDALRAADYEALTGGADYGVVKLEVSRLAEENRALRAALLDVLRLPRWLSIGAEKNEAELHLSRSSFERYQALARRTEEAR